MPNYKIFIQLYILSQTVISRRKPIKKMAAGMSHSIIILNSILLQFLISKVIGSHNNWQSICSQRIFNIYAGAFFAAYMSTCCRLGFFGFHCIISGHRTGSGGLLLLLFLFLLLGLLLLLFLFLLVSRSCFNRLCRQCRHR